MCEEYEGVENHPWSSDSCPAYRRVRALRSSKLIPQCIAVRAEGGGLLTEESEVKARWAGYFEQLYQTVHQLLSWMFRVFQSLLMTLQSTVVHLHLWKHKLR